MTWEDEFIADYKNLSEDELFEKYYRKIPAYISNAGFANRVLEINASDIFIDEIWYGDYRDQRTFFCCPVRMVSMKFFSQSEEVSISLPFTQI